MPPLSYSLPRGAFPTMSLSRKRLQAISDLWIEDVPQDVDEEEEAF
jgi:hypothetical protein